MPRSSIVRAGILFAVLPWFAISCGTKTATEPGLNQSVTAVSTPEQFLNSAQQEHRELILDGRPTPIEWNIAGAPTYVLLHGIGGGRDFLLAMRSVWTYDRFGAPQAVYFLFQWPDGTPSVLDHPIVNDSIDILDDLGNLLVDCRDHFDSLGTFVPGNDALIRPTSWHRSSIEEDQVTVEIFSDSLGSYPADNWRWGAGTTDPAFPSSVIEFQGAASGGDNQGQFDHPAAGLMEDRYDTGSGPVRDQGNVTYAANFAQYPDGVVPLLIASKGVRDTRLNRGHPTSYVVWKNTPARPLTACDSLNPVRVDDSSVRDKTWNPGDYVPGWILSLPTASQFDVLARGNWGSGKWSLEVRRNLTTYFKPVTDSVNVSSWTPWWDDVQLVEGRHYKMRITIYDASSTKGSQSILLPFYLKPR
jgi:hypothetical protein